MQALLPFVDQLGLEVIVSDGGSTDGTADWARRTPVLRVIEGRPGLGRQRNNGALQAHGDILVFLDADCSVGDEWAEALARLARAEFELAGGPVLVEGTSWVEKAWAVHVTVRTQRRHISERDTFRFISTANMVVRREAFARCGGFDEDLTAGEDTDFAHRIFLRGGKILFEPGLTVYHRGEPKTYKDFFIQQVWHSSHEVWRRLANSDHGRSARSAHRYGALHAGLLFLLLVGMVLSVVTGTPAFAFAALGALGLPSILVAGRTAIFAGRLRAMPALAALYGAYGVARAVYLLGVYRVLHKKQRF